MPAWITSLLRELVPVPIVLSRSSTITSRPASAKARATARPTTPAPITTVSICSTDTMRSPSGDSKGLRGRVRYFGPDDGESADTRTAARRGLAGDRAGRSRRGGDDRPGAAAGGRPRLLRLHRAQPSRRRADAAGAARGGAASPGERPRARSALGWNPAQPGKRAGPPEPF